MIRSIHAVRFCLTLALAAALASCGSNPPELVTLSVSPATLSIQVGVTQQFTATVSGASNSGVSWLVSEQGGGTITAAGLYTAPAMAGTFHVVATSLANSSVTATATIDVSTQAVTVNQISVEPGTASVQEHAAQQFRAKVNGAFSDDVVWTVASGGAGGAISTSGTYTAPGALGNDTVTATSTLDPTKSANAAVTVVQPAPAGITYSPAALTCTLNRFCSLPAPTSTGGAITSFTISPSLPNGLALNQGTGAISGTANQLLNPTTFMVSAINAGGEASAAVVIGVNDVPPSQLTYTTSELDCFVNLPCELDGPSSSGGLILSYSISPQLPNNLGISFNTRDGSISGTPTAALARATFQIIASNSGGQAAATVAIFIQDLAPATFSYVPNSVVCTVNTACTGPAPSQTGGRITSFTVSPALPAGLSLDAHTGIVSGTATALQASAAYVVTGSNSGGMLTAGLNIIVNDVPPSQVSYGAPTLNCTLDQPCSLGAPASAGGAITSFTVSPPLPTGLTLNADGSISGTPTAITAGQTYTITATNSGGSTTVTLTIAINDVPPSQLSYGSGGGAGGGSGGGAGGGSGGGSSGTAASLHCIKGTPCALAAPTSGGGAVTLFSSSPALPAGLVLGNNGSIAGTPTVVAATANYTITASNSGGQTSVLVAITVIDVPPANLAYSPSTLVCTKGTACSLAAPANSGGAIVSYSSSPVLPAGLAFGNNGSISGTPTAVAASAPYVVTGTNTGGQVSASVTIQVNDVAPSQFAYAPNSLTCTKGAACASAVPTTSGGAIVTFSASPGLPAGLSFAANGAISGTPTALAASAAYTITASNSGGALNTSFTLAVNDVPPAHITYSASSLVCTRGTPCSLAAPSNNGGPTTAFSSSPPLPAGLSFNSAGAISGTPTVASPTTAYAITAANSGGSTTTSLTILVNDAPPSALTYSPASLTCLKATPCSLGAPSVQGVVTSYTVNPALPAGLSLNGDGSISGTPVNITASGTYTVVASNSGGTTTANLTIAVNDNAPSNLTYAASPATCSRNQPCSIAGPTSGGAPVVSYSISPALPAGLTFNTSDGSISGTPTAASAALTYTITANSAGGSTTGTLSLGIIDPTIVTYSPAAALCTKGAACNFAAPAVSGGSPVTSFSVSPALPNGLSLNSGTGAISGVPTAVQATKSYTISGSTSGGNVTTTIAVTVLEPLNTFGPASLASGMLNTCVMANGGVSCWGDNSAGQLGNNSTVNSLLPVQVLGLTSGVQAVSVQWQSACAVVNGAVWCWGNNGGGQLGDGTITNRLVPVQVSTIAAGATAVTSSELTSCAIVNGGVKCWGYNGYGGLGNGTTTNSAVPVAVSNLATGVQALASTSTASCALQNGTVSCWGQNTHGEIGNGTTNNALAPVAVVGLGNNVSAIAAGEYHFCALASGAVWCWGFNDAGQLGNGSTVNALSPVKNTLGLNSGVQAIAAGASQTCALVNGGVQCWGYNAFGQLGNNSTSNSLTPVVPLSLTSGVQQISAGFEHTCAIAGGAAKCWGNNTNGQLGNNTTANVSTPTQVPSVLTGVQGITTGEQHSCAIVNGGVQCWGGNASGTLGNNSTSNSSVPVTVFGAGSGVTQIAAGYLHTCALINGGVQCWGYNASGQLGNGNNGNSLIPVPVSGLTSGVQAISAGWNHSCALLNDTGVRCWGQNDVGELGNNTTANSPTPVAVSGLTSGVQQIGTAYEANCALVNGGLKCWGDNSTGQMGNGTTANALIPAPVTSLTAGVQQIASGGFKYFCAAVNGGAQCWGTNGAGQLGNNGNATALTPTPVTNLPAGSGVQSLAGGQFHTCAVVNGGAQCWGTNTNGGLGNGTVTSSLVPVKAQGAGTAGVSSISAGQYQTCAIINGNIQCWGLNSVGQLGNNSTTQSLLPQPIVGPIGYLPQ